jgi:hypothetical protein
MKKIFIVLLVIAVGIAIYFAFFRMNRTKAEKIVAGYAGVAIKDLETFDSDYLIARARAIKNDKPTFEVAGSTYNTKDGRKA